MVSQRPEGQSRGRFVEFGVLGPLRVVVAGRAVPIGSARQRAVLAVLLLSPNRPVSTDRLVDTVWGPDPAASAHNLVRTSIWRLRELLTEDGARRVVTEPAGYLLRVEPGELDLAEFERLLGEGRAALARGEESQAAERMHSALGLWRGEPFADVTLHGGELAAEVQRLGEARVAGLEERIEADLALGRHEDMIGELQRLTASHPLRERITGQLMLACYRSSRQADALTAYAQISTRLAEELGMDPGRELQQLHKRILRADPDLLTGGAARRVGERIAPRQLPAAATAPWTPMFQLPAEVADFVGREPEIVRIVDALCPDPAAAARSVRVVAVTGRPGAGKTSLAVVAAHRSRTWFPDGQLVLRMNASDAGRRIYPARLLADALAAMGVPGDAIPGGVDARANLYLTMLTGRRVLVVIDDAARESDILPLLPGEPGCAILITSRHRLATLPCHQTVTVHSMPDHEAAALLASAAGNPDLAHHPNAPDLVALAGRLPLAVRIIGARLATGTLSPHRLTARLRDDRQRLSELRLGELDVRAAFEHTYQQLTDDAQRALRRLATIDADSVPAWAITAALATDTTAAEDVCDELVGAHLLDTMAEPDAPARLRLHDLIRAYARDLAHAHDLEIDRRAALARVCRGWIDAAERTAALIPGIVRHHAHTDAVLIDPEPTPHHDPAAWLAREQAAIRVTIIQAAGAGLVDLAWRMCLAMRPHYEAGRHFDDWRQTHEHALAAARTAGDHNGIAHLQAGLGSLGNAANTPDPEALHEAAGLLDPAADPLCTAYVYGELAICLADLGRLDDADHHAETAWTLFTAHHQIDGLAYIQFARGKIHNWRGDYDSAISCFQQARTLRRPLGAHVDDAGHQRFIGISHALAGRLHEAIDWLHQSILTSRGHHDLLGEATSLSCLGRVQALDGDHDTARQTLTTALAMTLPFAPSQAHVVTLQRLGELHRLTGEHPTAIAHLNKALTMAGHLNDPPRQALILRDLGDAHAANQSAEPARLAWQQAFEILHDLDLPLAQDLQRRLATTPITPPAHRPHRPWTFTRI
jgi:DNA-binding SARP family transcriptional activator/tetratricopeptide (TPR) repeat protein